MDYDIKIHIKKTKITRVSNAKETTVKISIDEKELEQVGKFFYLARLEYYTKLKERAGHRGWRHWTVHVLTCLERQVTKKKKKVDGRKNS